MKTVWVLVTCGLFAVSTFGQSDSSPIPIRLHSCLWSSLECDLDWKLTNAKGACATYSLLDSTGELMITDRLFVPPSILTFSEADYIDTLSSILLSFQLARYGERAFCDTDTTVRRVRLISIDESGLECLTCSCVSGRCEGTYTKDTANHFLIRNRIDPIVEQWSTTEKSLDRALRKFRSKCTAEKDSSHILTDFLVVEERSRSLLEQARYKYNRSSRQAFLRARNSLLR